MLIEAARRAEGAVKEMLAIATRGDVATDEVCDALRISKSIAGINSAFQAVGAAAVAGREQHGDGGAEILAEAAGLSRQEARGQVKTAQAIAEMPRLRDAVAEGRVSAGNARRLAEAVEKTSAEAVDADDELLTKAESMRPEQFARETRRWTVDRQGDGGESEHARQRARRRVRVWNADDGMVHLHGEFDAVTGKRIGNRLEAEARRMYNADKKSAADSNHEQRRTFRQCMADALDNLTTATASRNGNGGGKPFADIAVVWHANADTEKAVAEIAGGDRLPASVLEELMCNSAVTGLIYDTEGVPLWRGKTKRRATPGQMRALIAKYGGCFHCGAHPAMCQAHHIKPWYRGGPTDISNLVLACWNCHQKIHHHNWTIHTHRGKHTLQPPDRITSGPTRTPNPPPTPGPDSRRAPDRRTGSRRARPPLRAQPGVPARSRSQPQGEGTAAQQPEQARPGVPPGSRSRPPGAGAAAQQPEQARPGVPPGSRSRPRAGTSTTASARASRDGPDGPSPPSRSARLFTPA